MRLGSKIWSNFTVEETLRKILSKSNTTNRKLKDVVYDRHGK